VFLTIEPVDRLAHEFLEAGDAHTEGQASGSGDEEITESKSRIPISESFTRYTHAKVVHEVCKKGSEAESHKDQHPPSFE
jgi:hypothetical protein